MNDNCLLGVIIQLELKEALEIGPIQDAMLRNVVIQIIFMYLFLRSLSGPHAIFIWRIALAHGVGYSRKPPSNFFHGRAGSPSHFLALITLKTFGTS